MRSSQDDKSQDMPSIDDRYDVVAELVSREDAKTYIARRREDGSSRRRDDGAEVLIAVFRKPRGGEGDALSLFAADAQLLRAEGHPSLLPIVDAFWAGPEAFAIATPRVVAPTLAELLERGEKFSNFRIAAILRDLNGLLEWAREHKVVHRALSPDTLFIEPATDKVLALFEVRPLARGEFPGASDDARTIGSLARPMLAKAGNPRAPDHVPLMELRPDLPQRLVEAVEALALPKGEGAEPGDVRSFIAAIAMADAILAGEIEAAHMEAMMIEQQRIEREQWNAELEAHERRIADLEQKLRDERAEMERTLAEERERLAAEREELLQATAKEREELRAATEKEREELRAATEREREELRTTAAAEREALLAQLAAEREELHRTTEARRAELERAAEAERRAMAEERSRTEQELARRRRETEELVAAQAAAMAAERAQLEQEIAARRAHFEQELESLHAQLDTELAERELQFEERLAARRAEQAMQAMQEQATRGALTAAPAADTATPLQPTDADLRAAADARRLELERRARDEAREVERVAREARHGGKQAAAREKEVTPAAVPVADSPATRQQASAGAADDVPRPTTSPAQVLNPAFDPTLHPVKGEESEERERDGRVARWALPAAGIALVGVILTSALGIGRDSDRANITVDSAAGSLAPRRSAPAPRPVAVPPLATSGVAPVDSGATATAGPSSVPPVGARPPAEAAPPRRTSEAPRAATEPRAVAPRAVAAGQRASEPAARPADSQATSAGSAQDSVLAAALKARADSVSRSYIGPQLPIPSPATRRANAPASQPVPAPATTPSPTPAPPRPDSQVGAPPPT
ncbi:MAG: coiled-coil domain-containing protein [Gemmatimonadaceae bacterium]